MKSKAINESKAIKKIEPYLMVVLSKKIEAICREMSNTVWRSARSGVINSAKDFACTITDAQGGVINVAGGNQNQIVGTALVAKAMLKLHDDIRPGDAYMNNSPYYGGNHHADYTISVPVFYKGELLFTANTRAHQADIGNAKPTTYYYSCKDLYEEGALDFPSVRFQRDYKDIEDMIRMCKVRIRVPEQWYGDYLAMIGAVRIGEQRLTELCDRYGVDTLKAFVEQWQDYGRLRMEKEIAKFPKGTWEAETKHDPVPGIAENGIKIRLKMTIDPDEGYIELDFTESDDCVVGGMNMSEGSIVPAANTGVLNNLDPTIPHNEGAFSCIRLKLRENCVAGIPRIPTSASVATTNVADRMVNLVQSTFAQVGEDLGMAEGAPGMPVSYSVISGTDWRTGEPYVNQIILAAYGGPALYSQDGWISYGIPVVGSTILVDSMEVDEQKYPILFEYNELIPDSEGAGRWRGAPGARCIMRPRHDLGTWAFLTDGRFFVPKGIHGGQSGRRSDAWKYNTHTKERVDLPAIGFEVITPDEAIVSDSNGGGGFGDRLQRDPEKVRWDVLEGYVTKDKARDVYGVVINTDTEHYAVDYEATEELRRELKARKEGKE